MIETISAGPTTVILTGSHTNFAIFLMTYPHLKKNVEHIYIMGGGVRSKNPTGCCPKNATKFCTPQQCGDHGNLFTCYTTNPNAEFNIFGDPFSAYQVCKSQISKLFVLISSKKSYCTLFVEFGKGLSYSTCTCTSCPHPLSDL
jgi:inosine-uridine nucleoside N-ribohydrolase